MREYKIEIVLKLDDEGYILENNWLLAAIEERLGFDEAVIQCVIKELGV